MFLLRQAWLCTGGYLMSCYILLLYTVECLPLAPLTIVEWPMARMNDTLRMFNWASFEHPFICQFSRFVHHACIVHMYAFIECFLLPQAVCLCCLYWEWLKVRSVGVPKYTLRMCSLIHLVLMSCRVNMYVLQHDILCLLMQHYIEMSCHFTTELSCRVNGHNLWISVVWLWKMQPASRTLWRGFVPY